MFDGLRRQELEAGTLSVINLYLMWAACVRRVVADEWKKLFNSPASTHHAKQSCSTTPPGTWREWTCLTIKSTSACSDSSCFTGFLPSVITSPGFSAWNCWSPFHCPGLVPLFCRFIAFHSQLCCPHLLLNTEWAACLFWVWRYFAARFFHLRLIYLALRLRFRLFW